MGWERKQSGTYFVIVRLVNKSKLTLGMDFIDDSEGDPKRTTRQENRKATQNNNNNKFLVEDFVMKNLLVTTSVFSLFLHN